MRPIVVVIAVPVLAGLTVGLVYMALDQLGVGAIALGVGVTVGLWLLAAAGAVLRRLGRSESGHTPPPPASVEVRAVFVSRDVHRRVPQRCLSSCPSLSAATIDGVLRLRGQRSHHSKPRPDRQIRRRNEQSAECSETAPPALPGEAMPVGFLSRCVVRGRPIRALTLSVAGQFSCRRRSVCTVSWMSRC